MSRESWWTFAAACVGIGIMWAGSAVLLWPIKNRGEFGDMFGAVNALFSGLAFAGLIFTIHVQRKELSLQREELRLQREEQAASREVMSQQEQALASQAQTLAVQRFETTLSALLASFSATVAGLQFEDRQGATKVGRAALNALHERLYHLAAVEFRGSIAGEHLKAQVRRVVVAQMDDFYCKNTH